VSVLFADLVGFTTASEGRDAEETRELLSRYFETARTLIERYGGTVEKFIGDAVMAVWGAPVTQEDDAERAVRAGLELVAAVTALGSDVGADLAARAGVATGETAVTLAAEGQGLVAGDLVNTAARVQTAATPGTVFVTDDTRRASDAAIVYEDAGTHELKGKAEPMPLARAMRVIALRGGELAGDRLRGAVHRGAVHDAPAELDEAAQRLLRLREAGPITGHVEHLPRAEADGGDRLPGRRDMLASCPVRFPFFSQALPCSPPFMPRRLRRRVTCSRATR
jgi:class 3 adenylate cyclase